MGEVIFLVQEVNIVGRDQAAAQPLGQVRQLRVDHVLLGDVLLHFDEEAIGAEDFQVRLGDLLARPSRRAS